MHLVICLKVATIRVEYDCDFSVARGAEDEAHNLRKWATTRSAVRSLNAALKYELCSLCEGVIACKTYTCK